MLNRYQKYWRSLPTKKLRDDCDNYFIGIVCNHIIHEKEKEYIMDVLKTCMKEYCGYND